MDGKELACFALLLTIPTLARAAEPRVLVVVADARDLDITNRIGGEVVEVEAIITPHAEGDYALCNARAKRLRNFALYLSRADSSCRWESFWRERLTTANPQGQVRRVLYRQRGTPSGYDLRVLQLTQVHRALVSALPEHEASFNANLTAELQRLQVLRFQSSQFAASELGVP